MTHPTPARWRDAGPLGGTTTLGCRVIQEEGSHFVVGHANREIVAQLVKEHNALVDLWDEAMNRRPANGCWPIPDLAFRLEDVLGLEPTKEVE